MFKALLLATAAGLTTLALPALAQMAGGPAAEWARAVTRTQAEQEARAEFALADINKDGFVTPDEIHAAAETRMAAHRARAFDRLDTNHDGAVSREEFTARPAGPDGMMAGHPTAPGGPDRMMGHHVMMMHHGGPGAGHMMMADGDKDGRISQAEAVSGALKRFDLLDANHDGTVTPEERRAAMQAWAAKMREHGGRMHGAPMGDMPPPPPPAG
ncbi:hypothetical protein SPAN111604_04000 [Sphingomonas antarctica]|uniref:EF-hand domain-containing protein n=1 Tax=Sphingomonas antarctica TaxID=2040274 RepID=UPI0039E7AAEB